jgi:hypothetical protein
MTGTVETQGVKLLVMLAFLSVVWRRRLRLLLYITGLAGQIAWETGTGISLQMQPPHKTSQPHQHQQPSAARDY